MAKNELKPVRFILREYILLIGGKETYRNKSIKSLENVPQVGEEFVVGGNK
jgi:hypothetical protein